MHSTWEIHRSVQRPIDKICAASMTPEISPPLSTAHTINHFIARPLDNGCAKLNLKITRRKGVSHGIFNNEGFPAPVSCVCFS